MASSNNKYTNKHTIIRPVREEQLVQDFVFWLEMLGYQRATIETMRTYLYYLLVYLEDHGLTINGAHIEAFTKYVQHRPKVRRGKGKLSPSSIVGQYQMVRLLQEYYLYMRKEIIEVYLPPLKKSSPKRQPLNTLQIQSIYQVIEQETNIPLQLRDKALMAVLYGCGLRLGEARSLQIQHLLFRQALLYVLPGKTGVQRYVPMTPKVISDLKKYIYEGRYAALPAYQKHVFISQVGRSLSKPVYQSRLKKWGHQAQLDRPLSPHILRHSIATHLLEAGMSMEQISQFLGHRSLAATQIYTHIIQKRKR